MSYENAIEAKNLSKSYGQVRAVQGINFSVRRQECFGFLGANGAGKTSTMKMIYGRANVSAGELTVLGMDATKHAKGIRARVGVVPQENNLDPDVTVLENLTLQALYYGIPRSVSLPRARELLSFAVLNGRENDRARELSGGMKRRLVIARALMNQPEILVLDEPTTGLDPQARLLIWQKLSDLKSQGVTLVLTTHYMEEASRLCDRLVIMDSGRIIAEGKPRDLVLEHVAEHVLEVPSTEIPKAAMERVRDLIALEDQVGNTTYLYTHSNEDLIRRLREMDVQLVGAYARPSTLEDVFLHLTGRELTDGE